MLVADDGHGQLRQRPSAAAGAPQGSARGRCRGERGLQTELGEAAFQRDEECVLSAKVAHAAFDFEEQRVRLERNLRRELAGPGGERREGFRRERGQVQRDPEHGTVFSEGGGAAW